MKKGQSMFEVVLALFIITLIMVGIVSLSTKSVANSTFSKNKNLASRYSQEAIEWIRNEKKTSFATVYNLATTNFGKYCLDYLDWSNVNACSSLELIPETVFKRDVIFTVTANPTIINTKVVTSWTDQRGTHDVSSTTQFTETQ